MSSDYYRRQTVSLQQDISKLQGQKASTASDRARIQSRIADTQRSIRSASSPSTAQSRARDLDSLNRDLCRAEEKTADYESQIARKQQDLGRAHESLSREEESETRKRQQDDKRREEERERQERRRREEQERAERRRADDHARHMRKVSEQLQTHDQLHQHTLSTLVRLQQLPDEIVALFVAANPTDLTPLHLDEEIRSIEQKIRLSEHRDAVRLVAKWAVRPPDLLQALNEHKPHIVHFSGHGSDEDEIIFLDDAGNAKPVTKDAIVQMMSVMAGNIRVAVFNTCYSKAQAEAVVQHIDVAIGMNAPITDESARVFASQFYSAIGFGRSVTEAFNQARALLSLESAMDSVVPELFVREGVDANEIVLVKPPEV